MLARLWKNWREVLVIVQPETVISWHGQGFRLYWRWKSKARQCGRSQIDKEMRDLIRSMSEENPLWGAPRIQAELHLLGYDVAESTVAKYHVTSTKPPSQTWRTFLDNHIGQIAAIDFFTVPTATLRTLFCFVILLHDRRRVVHFNVTEHPRAEWTAQQMREAFPYMDAPTYLVRDRDQIYGENFCSAVRAMGIEEVVTWPHSPWQNPYAERLSGTIGRECLDHMNVLTEEHLRRILGEYFDYYHESRPHQSLARNSPVPREVERPSTGQVISIPQVGGLHHRYQRAA